MRKYTAITIGVIIAVLGLLSVWSLYARPDMSSIEEEDKQEETDTSSITKLESDTSSSVETEKKSESNEGQENITQSANVSISADSSYPQVTPKDAAAEKNAVGSMTSLSLPTDLPPHLSVDLTGYEFQNFSFSWEGEGEISFAFGSSSDDQLEFIETHTEDYGIVPSSDPVRFSHMYTANTGHTNLYIQGGDVSNLEVQLYNAYDETQSISVSAGPNHSSGMSYTTLNIISRYSWSGDPNINDPARFTWNPIYYPARRFVIHHTATDEDQDPEEAMQNIYNFHANSRGWGDIAYNYLIDKNGKIYEGKAGGEETMGYGADFWGNREVIAIAVIGDYSDHLPSSATLSSLKKLIAEKSVFYNIDLRWRPLKNNPDDYTYNQMGTFFGHRNYQNTACPGQDFYDYLPTLMLETEDYAQSHYTKIRNLVEDTGDILNDSQINNIAKLTVFTDPAEYSSPSDIVPVFSGITDSNIRDDSVVFSFTNFPEDWITEEDPDVSKYRMITMYKLFSLKRGISFQVMGSGMSYKIPSK